MDVDLSHGRSFASGFPHAFFAALRRERPLYWHPPTEHTPGGEGFWVISRHADAVNVMKDPVTFSSAKGTALDDSRGGGVLLNHSDDPQHRRLRALVNKGFTPRTIGRLEDDLRRRARNILDAVPVGEPFDFVPAVAQELPLQAICSILGVPQEDRQELAGIVNAGIESETGEIVGSDHLRMLGAYAERLLEQKRRQPADDILSIILHARLEDGVALADRELRAFFNLLFPAGAETTRGAIAGGLLAFIQHPSEWGRIKADGALMKTAVEEIVRWTSPSAYKRRTATRPVVLHGQVVAAGDKVTYWEMSANRDESVFTDAFRFDVGRDPNPHVGFGLGTHFCLGANLARLEIRVMFEALLDRYEGFELTGDPVAPPNNRLIGLTHLPVRAVPNTEGNHE